MGGKIAWLYTLQAKLFPKQSENRATKILVWSPGGASVVITTHRSLPPCICTPNPSASCLGRLLESFETIVAWSMLCFQKSCHLLWRCFLVRTETKVRQWRANPNPWHSCHCVFVPHHPSACCLAYSSVHVMSPHIRNTVTTSGRCWRVSKHEMLPYIIFRHGIFRSIPGTPNLRYPRGKDFGPTHTIALSSRRAIGDCGIKFCWLYNNKNGAASI
jgi:hypothetical protein